MSHDRKAMSSGPRANEGADLMAAIEGKYGEITSSKKEFHPCEPIFLFRATDPLAPEAIDRYGDLCASQGCAPSHIAAVRNHSDRIRRWQREHAELVKYLPGPSREEVAASIPEDYPYDGGDGR